MSIIRRFLIVVVAVLIPNIGGFLGGILITRDNLPWLDSLNKPKFNPPNYLFAPAWITLYSLMGISSYLVLERVVESGKGFDRTAKVGFALYVIQLILNWAWTPIFFQFHELLWVSKYSSVCARIANSVCISTIPHQITRKLDRSLQNYLKFCKAARFR